MDPLSLAYAALCLARATVGPRPMARTALAVLAGGLMTLLEVVIDPVAFFYAEPGWYFGIPVTNFLGWPARDARGSVGPGVALYYSVPAFDLAVTACIGEWLLLAAGTTVHVVTALALWWCRRGVGDPAPLREVR